MIMIRNYRLLLNYFFHYSFSLGFWSLTDAIIRRINCKKIYAKTHYKRYEVCKSYIRKHYSHIIKKYSELSSSYSDEKINENCIVWIFWWQGKNEMPHTVELCIESILRKMHNHRIIFIDKNTVNDYIAIPDVINRKFKNGNISYAHVSDFIRIALIKKYGGIWIDATMFMVRPIPSVMYDHPFFSINQGNKRKWVVTKDKWSICVLAGERGSLIFDYWYDMLLEYWTNEDISIGYLMSDCILAIGYEDIEEIRKVIDAVPVNNINCFEIVDKYGNEIAEDKYFEDIINSNNMFKLTYKQDFYEYKNDKMTYYGKILEYYEKR